MAGIEQINGLPFGRAYKITSGNDVKFLPSVTTVLKMNPDEWLDSLRAELGEVKFKEVQTRGADRGTVMHRWLEVFLEHYKDCRDAEASLLHVQEYMSKTDEFDSFGSDVDRAKRIGRELFYNFYSGGFHKRISEVLHNEIFMYTFFKGGWAGTCDFVYRDLDGKLVILDFKSSSRPKDPNHIDNYKMQTACYMFKYAEMYGEMPDRGEIVISNESDPELQWVTVPLSEMKIHLRKFLSLMDDFRKTPEWVDFDREVHLQL
jgi:hypothetical protein